MAQANFEWIRRKLQAKGYTQVQLAKAWDADAGFVSRFFSEARSDLITLQRAITLTRMIDMSLEDFAKALGLYGGSVLAPASPPNALPEQGTFSVTPINGALHIAANLVVNPSDAGDLLNVLANLTKK